MTHQYLAQDNDELSLERGEKIDVIPFDNPDEEVLYTVSTNYRNCQVKLLLDGDVHC